MKPASGVELPVWHRCADGYLQAAACGLLLIVLAESVNAQQYFKNWTTEDGLPQNNVSHIAQTPDGYLWLATADGVARFDGVRFKVFNKANTPEILHNRIFSMFTDTTGRLWFTYPGDQTIVVYENGKFKRFEKGRDFEKDEYIDEGLRYVNEHSRHWLRNPEMKFRAGSNEYVYENGRFLPRPAQNYDFPSRVFATDDNGVWIDDPDALYQVKDDKLTRYGKHAPLPFDPKLLCLMDSAERNGSLWFASRSQGSSYRNKLLSFKDGKLKAFPFMGRIRDLEFDAQDNLWISDTEKGIVRVDAATVARSDPADFPVRTDFRLNAWALFRDSDGNVWFGSEGLDQSEGLYLINPNPELTVYSRATGLPAENVYPIVQDPEGTIWFAAWRDKLINYRNGKFSSEDGFLLASLFVDRRGRLWKGAGHEIYYREENKWVPVNFINTIQPSILPSGGTGDLLFITEDKEGSMWFGTNAGLVRYAPSGSQFFTVDEGLPSNTVNAYLFARSGEMWIGTNGGVARMENGRFRAFTENDGLAGNYTRSFYEDAEGTIWIGSYDSGLTRYKNGSFTKITKRDGLFSDGVFVILEDDMGWFWMNSNQGIYRVRKQELNDFTDRKTDSVTSVSYGPEDGLLNVEGNGGRQPAGLKATDGKLWFPMAHGVAVIDSKTARRASFPPPVLVEEVRIDQKPFEISVNGIRLEPDQVALEIDYTALGFVGAERMRFRYRIEGLDEAWTEAGGRRTAYFSHLPYGEYTFRVIAANYDGVWNNEGASVKIVIVPPFYRESWFYVLAFVSVFGLITFIYLYRVRQLQTLNEARAGFARRLIESQESERRRIALDLHDSLGQTLAVIRNRTLIGLDAKTQEKSLEQLREISEASTVALRETREIAHKLHPAQIENLGLTTALRSLVKSVETATGMKFEADLGEVPNNFPYEAAISIYRITQESLSNIIKHSGASFAAVSLKDIEGKLVLTIEDDGRGFIESQIARGLGLTGIRERAKMISAEITITSQPEHGTKVELILPLG